MPLRRSVNLQLLSFLSTKTSTLLVLWCWLMLLSSCGNNLHTAQQAESAVAIPDTADIPSTPTGQEIRYGRELLLHTAEYLGPQGRVMKLCGTRMSCFNCHLDAGTRPYANNFLETYLKYPQYRAREGMVLTIEDRINNCFERPMNGEKLPCNSREMRAIVSYLRWLCEGRRASYSEDSLHLGTITFPDREASVNKGAVLYFNRCATCHGKEGEGKLATDRQEYIYPPLWGMYSYAEGSSMHRLILGSRFVKWSMPFTSSRVNPQLTDEEAFDVMAFVNCDSIHPRPARPLEKDCPDLVRKPIDFPSGPFLDSFPVRQHKYGPFAPIKSYYAKLVKS